MTLLSSRSIILNSVIFYAQNHVVIDFFMSTIEQSRGFKCGVLKRLFSY